MFINKLSTFKLTAHRKGDFQVTAKKYFHEEYKLPIGTSERPADLAIEIVGETTGKALDLLAVNTHYFLSPFPPRQVLRPDASLIWLCIPI